MHSVTSRRPSSPGSMRRAGSSIFLPSTKNILTCFETTAGEGFGPAKKILARIYGKGLGMKPDRQKANKVLRGLSKNEIKAVLNELSLEP